MTYVEREQSTHDGNAVELYEFRAGSEVWRLASRSVDEQAVVAWEGHDWEVAPIRRDEITLGPEASKASIKVELPLEHEFAAAYLVGASDVRHTLLIRRGHAGDPDAEFHLYWRGRVTAGQPLDGVLMLECESVYTSVRRSGGGPRFQKACRHTVYGRGCWLDPENFKATLACTAPTETGLTVPGAAAFPAGYFAGGMVRSPAGVLRYISAHSGETLVLWRPVRDLILALQSGPVDVDVFPGCLGDIDTCHNRFNNRDNYGGFRSIPAKNPMGGSSIV